ncbi:MAG: hypothetical protein LBH03_01045 [Holophagales bacterium]|jgi:hypothetical protein|nr:hypothetical protein [Holophagales bacterium]
MIRVFVHTLFLFLTTTVSLSAQNALLVPSFVISKAEVDAEKMAVIYYIGGKHDQSNREAQNYVRRSLGYDDLLYYELDESQYEVCCDLLQLNYSKNHAMFVLYFNGNSTQFPCDINSNVDISQRLRNLGWKPTKERLEEFLALNPYNQEAISKLFTLTLQDLKNQTFPPKTQNFASVNRKDDALPSFLKALKLLVSSEAMEWMTIGLTANLSRINLGELRKAQILSDNSEFQLLLNDYVRLIEKNIKQRPLSVQLLYRYWFLFNSLKRNPTPLTSFLRELNFPKGTDTFMSDDFIHDVVLDLARNQARYSDKNTTDKAFHLLDEATEWMLEKDPRLDDVFGHFFVSFAMDKARLLIQYHRYLELEKHLEDTKNLIDARWSQFVIDIKKPGTFKEQNLDDIPQINRVRIDSLLELPPSIKNIKPFNGISLIHNIDENIFNKVVYTLQQKKVYSSLTRNNSFSRNSWLVYNAGSHVASGSILPVDGESSYNAKILDELFAIIFEIDQANFLILKQFVKENPDNLDAIDIYCTDASKFLPDEELENSLLRCHSRTHTPPSLEAFSKMKNKDEWYRLASRVIAEDLLRINDTPISSFRNPWLNLSRWEDLEPDKFSIDWYSLLKDSVFWYSPEYYFAAIEAPMPEVVFTKYLNQAEMAKDWEAVILACRTRYRWDKNKVKEGKIQLAWERAETMLKDTAMNTHLK